MTKKFTNKSFYSLFFLSIVLLFAACSKKQINPAPTPPSPPVPVKKWFVSTVAGSGTAGSADGDTTQAQFNNAQGIVADNKGNLFVADLGNYSIRKVTYAGHVTTYASNSISNLSSASGVVTPNSAFGGSYSITIDGQSNLYIIDYSWIRKIASPTNITILAGQALASNIDGTGANAGFHLINKMAIDGQGNIFLPDYDLNDNFILRKVTPSGVVTTLPLHDNTGIPSNGTPNFHYVYVIAVDPSGNIYLGGNGNTLIKKIDPAGNVTLFAGAGTKGLTDGKGAAAEFNTIYNMTCDASGNLWVTDGANNAIRKVTPDGNVTTIVATAADGTPAYFSRPAGITVDNAGVIFVMDTGSGRVLKLEYK